MKNQENNSVSNMGAKIYTRKLSEEDNAIHQQFQDFGMNAKQFIRKCELLLPEIARRRIWQKKRFNSIYEYAAKLAGMSKKKVKNALWILHKIKDFPKLRKVVEEKGLNRVEPILKVVDAKNEGFWARKAMNMSRNTLRVYVNDFLEQNFSSEKSPAGGTRPQGNGLFKGDTQSNLFTVSQGGMVGNLPTFTRGEGGCDGEEVCEGELSVSEKVNLNQNSNNGSLANQEPLTLTLSTENAIKLKKLKNNKSWDEVVAELLEMREKQLEREYKEEFGEEFGDKLEENVEENVEEKGKVSNQVGNQKFTNCIPAKNQKFIKKRSNNICEVTACHREATEFHHTKRQSLHASHDPKFIKHLCHEHHQLAHQGLIENENGNNLEGETWQTRTHPDTTSINFQVDQSVLKHGKA